MKLHVLGSSSAGNGYILEGETSALVIEAGVPLKEAKKAIGFNIAKIEGVIISHSHGDHCGRANEYTSAGLQVFSNLDTLKTLDGRYSYRLNQVRAGAKYKIREFTILPFNVVHDVTTYGYLIQHEECGLTCFITDSWYSPARFPGMNNILVEANYMEDILFDNVQKDIINPYLADRVRKSHMSFETCLEFLDANDLSAVNNIVLLHLSSQNASASQMKEQLEKRSVKNVHVARKGMTIELNKTPF